MVGFRSAAITASLLGSRNGSKLAQDAKKLISMLAPLAVVEHHPHRQHATNDGRETEGVKRHSSPDPGANARP